MIMELQRELTADASDYFDTTYGVEEVKMSVRRSYPYVPLFLSSLEQETNPEALEAVSEYLAVYKEKMNSVYEAVDRSRFASFVDPDIFDMTVKFTMKGILEEEYEKEVFDERRYMDRIRTFLEQMRKMTLRENAGEE